MVGCETSDSLAREAQPTSLSRAMRCKISMRRGSASARLTRLNCSASIYSDGTSHGRTNLESASELHRGVFAQLRQYMIGQEFVDGDHGHCFRRFPRFGRTVPAAEGESRDVDFIAAEHASDVADDAGHVPVLHKNEEAGQRDFAIDA